MFRKRRAEPERKPFRLMDLVRPAGPCACRWEPLGFTPVSFVEATILLREGQALPQVAAGHIHYCERHGGAA